MRRARMLVAAVLAAACLGGGLGGCAVNPATGGKVFTGGVTGAQEKAAGRKAHSQILGEIGPRFEDEELQNYVSSVGQLLARTTERRDLEYTFTVVDSDTVNAFAAPGGHIYITRGLLALVGDEAELASVLGHELGHITALHYARGRGQTILVQLGLLAADVLAQRAGAATVRSVLNDLGGTAGLAYLRSHSRENEYESDDLGIRYLARAGYDTQGAARNLAKLRAHARLKARLAGRSPDEIDRFDYTATHPAPVKRIRRAIDIAARTPVRKPMVARDVFLRKIDGLFYGGSPEQGFVRGREFIHPRLRFRFTVPDTYTLHNSPSVVIASGGGGALITLQLHGRGRTRSAAGFLRGRWAGKLSLGRIEELTVNGQPAATARAAARSARGAVDIRILIVGSDENRVYETVFVVPRGRGSRLDTAYRQITSSLRELTESEAATYRPRRIRVVEARPGDTQESLARRMAVEERPLEYFRMLNGLKSEDRIVPGRPLKLIVE